MDIRPLHRDHARRCSGNANPRHPGNWQAHAGGAIPRIALSGQMDVRTDGLGKPVSAQHPVRVRLIVF